MYILRLGLFYPVTTTTVVCCILMQILCVVSQKSFSFWVTSEFGIWRTRRHTDKWAASLHRSRPPADQSGKRVASWTEKSPHTPDTRDILVAFSRGCHACLRGCYEDATRKLLPWNLSLSLLFIETICNESLNNIYCIMMMQLVQYIVFQFLARDVIYTCQCPSVCPSVCDGSALAHYRPS